MGLIKQIKSIILLVFISISCFSEPARRVLIFSAPFGSGHNAAAARIKEKIELEFQSEGSEVEVKVVNTLEFAPKWLTDIALHNFSKIQTHAPILYSYLFEKYINRANKTDHAGEMSLFKDLRIDANGFEDFILNKSFVDAENKAVPPDVIISTWPGATELLMYLKHKKDSLYNRFSKRIPIAHVQTDNADHDRYFQQFAKDRNGNNAADVVYVPNKEIFDTYTEMGIDNVEYTGMPVKLNGSELPTFEERQLEKQKYRSELGLDSSIKTIMIEAGKNGAANYSAIIASILKFNPNEKFNIIAACGDNESYQKILEALSKGVKRGSKDFEMIHKELKELYSPKTIKNFLRKGLAVFSAEPVMTKDEVFALIEKGLPNNIRLIVKGYVPLDPLRRAADLILTKPGGLSTAELGVDGRPMIILQEYASGEALPNGPIFQKKNLALIAEDISKIGENVKGFYSDEHLAKEMYIASARFRKEFNLGKIMPFVKEAGSSDAQENSYRSGYQESLAEYKKSIQSMINTSIQTKLRSSKVENADLLNDILMRLVYNIHEKIDELARVYQAENIENSLVKSKKIEARQLEINLKWYVEMSLNLIAHFNVDFDNNKPSDYLSLAKRLQVISEKIQNNISVKPTLSEELYQRIPNRNGQLKTLCGIAAGICTNKPIQKLVEGVSMAGISKNNTQVEFQGVSKLNLPENSAVVLVFNHENTIADQKIMMSVAEKLGLRNNLLTTTLIAWPHTKFWPNPSNFFERDKTAAFIEDPKFFERVQAKLAEKSASIPSVSFFPEGDQAFWSANFPLKAKAGAFIAARKAAAELKEQGKKVFLIQVDIDYWKFMTTNEKSLKVKIAEPIQVPDSPIQKPRDLWIEDQRLQFENFVNRSRGSNLVNLDKPTKNEANIWRSGSVPKKTQLCLKYY